MDFVNTELAGNKHLFTVYRLNPFTSGGFYLLATGEDFLCDATETILWLLPFSSPDCTGAMSLPLMARYKVIGFQLDSSDPQIYVMCN